MPNHCWTILALSCFVIPLAVLQNRSASAYPEPSIVPRSWEFDFTIAKPEPIAVKQTDGSFQWYWFMAYTVTNNTGEERLFIPEITIATDEGDIITPGRDVPLRVFDAVKAQLRDDLIERPNNIIGRILQGADNARSSVIIWPALPHHVSELKVFISGLSGETAQIKNPRTGDTVLLAKTLMLTYRTPGKPKSPQDQAVIEDDREWVMR